MSTKIIGIKLRAFFSKAAPEQTKKCVSILAKNLKTD
jgi:hypothetical protein